MLMHRHICFQSVLHVAQRVYLKLNWTKGAKIAAVAQEGRYVYLYADERSAIDVSSLL